MPLFPTRSVCAGFLSRVPHEWRDVRTLGMTQAAN